MSSPSIRNGSSWSDRRDVVRGMGSALKRSQSVTPDRVADRVGPSNGSPPLAEKDREAGTPCSRGKSNSFRLIKGEKMESVPIRRNRDLFIRLLIGFVAACFLAATFMQGSIMMLLQHTEFLKVPGGDHVTDSGKLRFTHIMEGSSNCERAVWLATANFIERLPQKSSIQDLSTEGRFSRRAPRIALVCPSLDIVPDSLYLLTIARGLQWLGYDLELYARQDGHLRSAWDDINVAVNIVPEDESLSAPVDWSTYEGVIAISLAAKKILSSLAKYPFTDIPVIWAIQENAVLDQVSGFNSSKELKLVLNSWQDVFNRSSVVVFPNYYLPIIYKEFYNEKFYVVAGSPWDIWEAEQYMIPRFRQEVRVSFNILPEEFSIVVVGSPCLNKGIWMDHALVIKAVKSLVSYSDFDDIVTGAVKLFILDHGKSTRVYREVLQEMAFHIGLQFDVVHHVGSDVDIHGLLWAADAVIYASLLEEHSFPSILVRAMTMERPVIAPDLGAIHEHIVDRQSGFLVPAGDEEALGRALIDLRFQSGLTYKVSSKGREVARKMFAVNTVVEYGHLLEKLLDLPEDAQIPRLTDEIKSFIPSGWRWDLVGDVETEVANRTVKDLLYLKAETDLKFLEIDWDIRDLDNYSLVDFSGLDDEDLKEERETFAADLEDRVEDEELRDRLESFRTTFEDVSKYVKKTETRLQKDEHRERDNLELERVGQPIIVYETFRGSGAWHFLHRDKLLYQGLSLSTKGTRPDADDIDGQARLPLLNESYYRDVLCEFGGFFAIGNFIDRIHRNVWIGFQPWHAASHKVALSPTAEARLVLAVSSNADGDALYFWSESDSQLPQDFWDMCDAVNGGNCRDVFRETWKKMYGLSSSWTRLPPMPSGGGSWSTRHCWAMPTSSFLDFVRFSRLFVDSLDSLYYKQHHDEGLCSLSRSKAEGIHCYCRLLEGLINVWAYHSAQKMILLNPNTGDMVEHHNLESRRGTMWTKFFHPALLKSMDEDLAEEFDDEASKKRWIWPLSGEVFWQGSLEKERQTRYRAKLEKKRKQLERQARQSKYKQKAIGGKVAKL